MANHPHRPFAEASVAHQEDTRSPKVFMDTLHKRNRASLSSTTPQQYPLSALKNDADYNDASSLTMSPPRHQLSQTSSSTQPTSSTRHSLSEAFGGTTMTNDYDAWETQPLHHHHHRSRNNSLTSTSQIVGLIQAELDLTPWAHDTSALLQAVSQFLQQHHDVRIPESLLLLHAPMNTITMIQYRALIQFLQQGGYQWSEPVPGIIQVLVVVPEQERGNAASLLQSSVPSSNNSEDTTSIMNAADQAYLLKYYQELTAKLLQERADMERAAKIRLQEEEQQQQSPQQHYHSQHRSFENVASASKVLNADSLLKRRNAVAVSSELEAGCRGGGIPSSRSSTSSLSSTAELTAGQLLRQQMEADERLARHLEENHQDHHHKPGAFAVVEPDRNSLSTHRTITQVPPRGRRAVTSMATLAADSAAARRRPRLAPRPLDGGPPVLMDSSTSSFLDDEDDVALQLALKLSSHHSTSHTSQHDQESSTSNLQQRGELPAQDEAEDHNDVAFQIALELSREHTPEELPRLQAKLSALGLSPELLSQTPMR